MALRSGSSIEKTVEEVHRAFFKKLEELSLSHGLWCPKAQWASPHHVILTLNDGRKSEVKIDTRYTEQGLLYEVQWRDFT